MCLYESFNAVTCKLLPCFDTVDEILILLEGDAIRNIVADVFI